MFGDIKYHNKKFLCVVNNELATPLLLQCLTTSCISNALVYTMVHAIVLSQTIVFIMFCEMRVYNSMQFIVFVKQAATT